MKTSLSLPYLRWRFACAVQKTGKKTLLSALIPVVLAGCWQFYLIPENTKLTAANTSLRHQLNKSLPLLADSKNSTAPLQRALNDTEYEQVKTLFDIFQQNHLQVDGSHYQFGKQEKTRQRALSLTIPLQGEWMNLTRSLNMMSKKLTFSINRLSISRASPEKAHLQINLQLTLNLASRVEPS